jgi:hypothetical protein
MINGECAYACACKENNENGSAKNNGDSEEKKVYICVKETVRKACPYVGNCSACNRYEPR